MKSATKTTITFKNGSTIVKHKAVFMNPSKFLDNSFNSFTIITTNKKNTN